MAQVNIRSMEKWGGRVKLVVFDLDGTLAPSKSHIDSIMAKLLSQLLTVAKVAVISGGRYSQFQEQFLSRLTIASNLKHNLFLFPTTATSFFRYRVGWRKVYAHNLTLREKQKIKRAFHEVFGANNYSQPTHHYGQIIEDRDTQITFSALGQKAPVSAKEKWNKKYNSLRLVLRRELQKLLPEFEVRSGGLTSIDVTKKGIDKTYGIRQIEKHLKIPRSVMLFVGDAIYIGGNDYAAVKTGVRYLKVDSPKETKKFIQAFVSLAKSRS